MENVTRKSLNVSGMANNQAARQTVTIQMSNALEAGHVYTVSMRFTSILNNQLRGFYRSTYEDQNGQTKYLAQLRPLKIPILHPVFVQVLGRDAICSAGRPALFPLLRRAQHEGQIQSQSCPTIKHVLCQQYASPGYHSRVGSSLK